MEDIGTRNLQLYLLSNIQPENPKIKFESSMLTYGGSRTGFSANPYFTDDVKYDATSIMKLPYEERVPLFFVKARFLNMLKSGTKRIHDDKDDENGNVYLKIASHNIMVMLRALISTRFPIENNVTDSLGKYSDGFSGIWDEFMKRVKKPTKIILGAGDFSSITYNGGVYTFTRAIWLNDLLNHPRGKELIAEYRKWKRWVTKSSRKLEDYKKQQIMSKEMLSRSFESNNPLFEEQKKMQRFLAENKPFQTFFYEILPKYADLTMNHDMQQSLKSKSAETVINFFEGVLNRVTEKPEALDLEIGLENKEGILDVYIMADFIGSDKELDDVMLETIKCPYYDNKLTNLTLSDEKKRGWDVFKNRVFFSTKEMKAVEQKTEPEPELEEYKVEKKKENVMQAINDEDTNGKYGIFLNKYYGSIPNSSDTKKTQFETVFSGARAMFDDSETKSVLTELEKRIIDMDMNSEKSEYQIDITDKLYAIKKRFDNPVRLIESEINRLNERITSGTSNKAEYEARIKKLDNKKKEIATFVEVIDAYIQHYSSMPERVKKAMMKGGRKNHTRKNRNRRKKRKTYRK